jgi:hypothetical protein
MDGYTWVFEVGQNQMDGTLVHPKHGLVWTLGAGSTVHEQGHMRGQCQCSITYLVDVKTILERVKAVRDMVLNMVSEG